MPSTDPQLPSGQHPLTPPSDADSAAVQAEPVPATFGPVLMIDDDPQLCRVVAEFLRDEGFLVDTASTAAQALALIEQRPPALILLDMHLPGMPGWELAGELTARNITAPIIVMTAAENARDWARAIGAVSYIAKPISLPSLVRRLDDLSA